MLIKQSNFGISIILMRFLLLIIFSISAIKVSSQNCTTLGQNPSTAFPVCGTDTFTQVEVPPCGGRQIPAFGCTDFLSDVNPFWYRFTCFSAGTLAFTITPNNLSDDYDWQLFDITNRNPDDVYTDVSMFVACNWSGESGATGASIAGSTINVCGSTSGGPYRPLFSSMPNLIQGHEYILLISHFAGGSQSGYGLSFSGGTASITDPTIPLLIKARAICDGIKMSIKLNKKMKCGSLTATGTEFVLSPPIAPIISAVGVNCSNGFDMDSIVVTLGNPIPPGNYTLTIRPGSDGNNLLDNCGREIQNGQSLAVTVFPLIPTPMDSIVPLTCANDQLTLVFKKPMQCSSISRNGSDFVFVNAPPGLTVTAASGNCNQDGLTDVITVFLSQPITKMGTYGLRLQVGNDGNTLINECGKETPIGAFITFTSKDTVSADFNYLIKYGCKQDTVVYTHPGYNNVNYWLWNFDNSINGFRKDTSIIYPMFGEKTTTLIVSNGFCSDTVSKKINLDNYLEARFTSTLVVCPEDPGIFRDTSLGKVIKYNWTFGNGNTSNLKLPPPQYYTSFGNTIQQVPVRLVIEDIIGCKDTAINYIKVVGNCYIAVPKAFSPNGDGLNDFLYPTNAYKARDLKFVVFNRFGQKLFETNNWLNKWNGNFKGNPQDPGTYVWFLEYTNIDTREKVFQKGFTVLIR